MQHWLSSAPSLLLKVRSSAIDTKIRDTFKYYILSISETTSAPQVSGNFGNFQNTSNIGGGGGNNGGLSGSGLSGGVHPQGEMSNRSATVPGSGYPGGYADRHGNDSLPTAPPGPDGSELQGGLTMANSTVPPANSACDSENLENAPTAPSGVPTGAPGNTEAGTK